MYTRQTCKKLQLFTLISQQFPLYNASELKNCHGSTKTRNLIKLPCGFSPKGCLRQVILCFAVGIPSGLWRHVYFLPGKLLLISFCLLVFCKTGDCQVSSGEIEKKLEPVIMKIDSLIKNNVIPSASLAIVRDEKVLWMQSYGWADIEKKIKATPETVYGLGSLSKSITSTGVMTLVEKGRINLDDSVNPLIAPAQIRSFVGDPNDVKVWHLLHMQAGIPHGWTSFTDRKNVPETPQERDAFFTRTGLITFPPGKVSHYSNYSLGVADLLIERVSRQSLEDYMQQKVFRPLGMKQTFTRFNPERAAEFATFYNSDLERMDHYDFLPRGGGGFYASASDLALYGQFFLKNKVQGQKKILKEKTIDLMFNFDRGVKSLIGLGWFNTGHSLISNGRISGAQSMISLIPSENLIVVCLVNASPNQSIADEIADQIIDLLAPDLEKKLTYETYVPVYETPYKLNEKLKGTWSGTIQTQEKTIPVQMDFRTDEKVYIKVGNEPEQELNEATFNLFDKLEGNFQSKIPVPEFEGEESVYTTLHLFLDGNRLVGHVAPMFSNEKGSFSYGAFMTVSRN